MRIDPVMMFHRTGNHTPGTARAFFRINQQLFTPCFHRIATFLNSNRIVLLLITISSAGAEPEAGTVNSS
jgi:hypothetical protein